VQLGDEKGEQIRLSYTAEEATSMANALLDMIKKIEASKITD